MLAVLGGLAEFETHLTSRKRGSALQSSNDDQDWILHDKERTRALLNKRRESWLDVSLGASSQHDKFSRLSSHVGFWR